MYACVYLHWHKKITCAYTCMHVCVSLLYKQNMLCLFNDVKLILLWKIRKESNSCSKERSSLVASWLVKFYHLERISSVSVIDCGYWTLLAGLVYFGMNSPTFSHPDHGHIWTLYNYCSSGDNSVLIEILFFILLWD